MGKVLLRLSAMTAVVWVLGFSFALAETYPSRPVNIIVPNSPGSLADLVARLVAPEMSKALGQPIIVLNKPGADQQVGYGYVAKQVPADGYSIVVSSPAQLAALPLMAKNLSFDPGKDLPPVIDLFEGRYVLLSSVDQPWKSFDEFVAYAKERPGKLFYGSSSVPSRLVTEMMLRACGLKLVHVPYNGVTPFLQAALASEIQIGFFGESSAIPVRDKIRALGVTGQKSEAFPDAPVFSSLGLPQLPTYGVSLNVRDGTPKEIVDVIHGAAEKALQDPEVRSKLARLQMNVPQDVSAAAAQRNLIQQAKFYAEVAVQIGLAPQ